MSARIPYASTSDVLALLPYFATFTPTSKPNATQVHRHLITASNELDAALVKEHYVVPVGSINASGLPVVASLALDRLRTWAAVGAAALTAYSTPQGEDSKHAKLYDDRFTAILKGIADNEFEFTDADRAPVSTLRQRMRGPGRSIEARSSSASPYFVRDDELLP